MSVQRLRVVDEAPADGQAVQDVYIEGLDAGSAEPADGAVTTVKIADGAVTAAKLASGVIPSTATTETAGLVKQAAHVADPVGETPTKTEFIALRDALVTAGVMAAS